jgi:hypothetical protein
MLERAHERRGRAHDRVQLYEVLGGVHDAILRPPQTRVQSLADRVAHRFAGGPFSVGGV